MSKPPTARPLVRSYPRIGDGYGLARLPALAALTACLSFGACAERTDGLDELDATVRDYLVLELAMSPHDSNHVDAWYGPPEIQAAAEEAELSLEQIDGGAATLIEGLGRRPIDGDSMQSARLENLLARLRALRMRIAVNRGRTLSFDDESERLFGATAPDHDAEYFAAILAEIDDVVPGDGSLSTRVNAFRDQFIIPPDRLEPVLAAAIAECRRRTREHIDLPDDESFTLEFVRDKPWSGYNWYQGDYLSLIQINTDLPLFISRAVDLGCHEGYPGHHTFNVLREKHLVEERGWLEFTLYPLFSPESLIAEGSGNYGIELAFPGDERIEFEKRQLFPLAGIDPARAERYYELNELMERLNYAGNEAARDYLDGRIGRDEAAAWLVNYDLASPERAMQRVDFFDTYRSYVINYNLGQDLVRRHVERNATTPGERWRIFTAMLSQPTLPADLTE